jgi:hypothetical protein
VGGLLCVGGDGGVKGGGDAGRGFAERHRPQFLTLPQNLWVRDDDRTKGYGLSDPGIV